MHFLAFHFFMCLANLHFCGSACFHYHAGHHPASNCAYVTITNKKRDMEYVHAFQQLTSQVCLCLCCRRRIWSRLQGMLGERTVWYKCHYLAGASAYCAHRGWVLLAACRGEVGGVYQPVWWTTKWIEWRMWWREREGERRSEWFFREKPTHTHSQKRRRKWSFLVGRKINKRGNERWSSFPENSISSFYSSDDSPFLEHDEIAFWAILKESDVSHWKGIIHFLGY